MNTRKMGNDKEQLAAEYLNQQGMRIVERNFRCRQGEIDMIGWHNGYLVFVEVKYRKNLGKGSASAAVDTRKQRRICMVADYYRYSKRLGDNTMVRYDVVAIQDEEVQWIQNAFPHIFTRDNRI